MHIYIRSICIFTLPLLLAGCFSPTYVRPVIPDPIPAEYAYSDKWKEASPSDAIDRGAWWTVFQESTLDKLMGELHKNNQKIAIAASNYRQARAQIGSARADFFPTVSLPGSLTRRDNGVGIQNTYSAGIRSQWELSLWNTIPAYEASIAEADASAADYAAMRLAMEAELAQSYFQLRALDSQITLYESTIAAYAKAVQLTRSQYQAGMVTGADVAQAETQLASAEAQLADFLRQRAIMQNTIALLLGHIPSAFHLDQAELTATLPTVPVEVPSMLLERRPDIASAERKVAAANERIGIARAAWFPTISLSGERIVQAIGLSSSPLTIWSFGPSAALSLFEGGKRISAGNAAWSAFEASSANYKQTVLEAFKEVEDNLAASYFLRTQAEAQDRAVAASQMALRLSLSQYRGGMTTYLQVVNTQTSALTNERTAIQIHAQRLVTAVNLIKALGGGWDQEALKALTETEVPQEGRSQ